MKLKDLPIVAMERMGEFLDSVLQALIGKNHSLEASFERPSKLISAKNKGFSVTGKKHLSVQQSRNNMVIISPSGGGKTTSVIYPSIFNIESSMLISDPSGELIQTKNYLLSKGFKVKVLDFGNKEHSLYYNPLRRIKNNADVNKIAQMLVRSSSKSEGDFWSLKSTELIGLFINFLLETAPKVNQNLANVFRLLELLQAEPKDIDALFADKAPEYLWRKYKSLMGNSENTRASIISSAQASLSFIGNDKTLSDLTSIDTFNFDDFRREKTVVFLRCPLGDMNYYSTILSILFEQFFSHVFNELPKQEDDDIFVLIDELSSLHLPNLSNIISNARKFKIPILGVLQSENQLYNNYGSYNAKTILNNANVKVYFTGLTDESIHLEKTLGTYEYQDDKGIKRKRSLMTSDEIRTMSKDTILVIPSGMRPLRCKVTPYYKQQKLVGYMNMETPTEVEEIHLNFEVQYLDLSKYNDKELSSQKENEIQ
ncbi:Protein VirD4 [Polaribacter huanghezhanensis]|uniref:type IV secretory system conjugative DNA transfer family protein n=1 Tax=Polaribacter huanghezhanensis TaxID=1354726 RepID=UPI002647F350|nr:type IV secretory system conjugative DNA transfer family protein [Polaribacter huanghezhanensis]WKD85201.1 Protein VirD4 [Polaribacter huanghezhanensis]